MVHSEKGEVRIIGTGLEIIADIGGAISSLLDNIYDIGINENSAHNMINNMVKAAFETSKYHKNDSDDMSDEMEMFDAFNKALDEVESKILRRKNVKRDL